MPATNLKADRNARALAGLRLAVGLLFLIFGQYKVFGTQFTRGGGFEGWINGFLAGRAYAFMVPVLRDFVLAHPKPIAYLVAYGEFAIGLGLILGILVRTASVCGFIYMLALLFASDHPGANVAFWRYFGASLSHLPLAMCFAAFAVGNADDVLALLPRWRRRSSRQ